VTPYDRGQVRAIERWKAEPPSLLTQTSGIVFAPVGWLARRLVPASAVEKVLAAADAMAREMATGDAADTLEACDTLAEAAQNRAVAAATAEGAAAGAAGLIAAPLDIPAMVVLSLRTIHRIARCYGFPADQRLALAVLSVASANSVKDRRAAVAALGTSGDMERAAETAAGRQLSREAVIVAIRALARRRALAAVPVAGAALGAGLNGAFLNSVAWAARRTFQERWLARLEGGL
jgi:hypothetical protein